MNFQLHHVISDISGVTGLKIIRAIVARERDPGVMASMRVDANRKLALWSILNWRQQIRSLLSLDAPRE